MRRRISVSKSTSRASPKKPSGPYKSPSRQLIVQHSAVNPGPVSAPAAPTMQTHVTIASLVLPLVLNWAAGTTILAPLTTSQFHAQDALGQYSYGYTDAHSSKVEVKTLDGVTRGGYNYVDANGHLQTVQYTSDPVHGFRVGATNLPQGISADTAEVLARKSEEENETVETPVPPATVPIPADLLHAPALLAPLPLHPIAPLAAFRFAAPGLGYAYNYAVPTFQFAPAGPVETPEVVQARAEHLKAVEQAKAGSA